MRASLSRYERRLGAGSSMWPSLLLNREHVLVAVLAAILSLVMHWAGLMLISDMDLLFNVMPRHLRDAPSQRQFVHLGTVTRAVPPSGIAAPGLRPWDPEKGPDDLMGDVEIARPPPDERAIEPPPLPDEWLSGEEGSVAEPSPVPERDPWDSNEDMLVIEKKVASDSLSVFDRRRVPRLERVSPALAIAVPLDADAADNAALAVAGRTAGARPAPANVTRTAVEDTVTVARGVLLGDAIAEAGSDMFSEEGEEITPLQPIEDMLSVNVQTFKSPWDWKHGYFRLEIERTGAGALPVLPKDVVLIQDCSASMTEQRLHFCREGLTKAVDEIGKEDRFNVLRFQGDLEPCFEGWTQRTPDTLRRARLFIKSMTAGGETDIFSSMKSIFGGERVPGRPVTAILVSDGMPTAGLTDSSAIIGDFSRLNRGEVSVFALGTVQTANAYLLDLLTYCNRGGAFVVSRGRWDIPDALYRIVHETSRPVLANVRFRFAEARAVDVYPVLTSNLYLDRKLVLHGRYPLGTPKIAFQAVGRGRERACDMVFSVLLDESTVSKDKNIRIDWARQKIYHLIGVHARHPTPELLEEIKRTARSYGLRIPYEGTIAGPS
ncbi:MAG: hypothetical protein HQ559_03185 [Lentisphaerae bacterium]|nr:hypothetical protein [Lentisphaerota bacterium]